MKKVTDTRWMQIATDNETNEQNLADYPAVLRRMLFNRKIYTQEQAELFLYQEGSLHNPFLLKGMQAGVVRLWQAIDAGEKIAVYGDYDADGVTATALMMLALRSLNANVSPYIPNRFEEGYGLNCDAIEHLASEGVQLIITVDCGIRSPAEVEYARQLGVDVIISDHHEPREDLPLAAAVICQKQPGDEYPEKGLAGVGLAFKIIQAALLNRNMPIETADEWLDLVAVGTVSDLVPLTGENRSLVKAGLKQLQQRRNIGLRALMGAASLGAKPVTARDVGFTIGPRLNAAGRLETAFDALNLLISSDPLEAGVIAQRLDDQNRLRQSMTAEIQEQAMAMAENDGNEHLIFSVSPEFNMGIVGLAASKLTESFYRPAIVGFRGEEETRASCRSIAEFHITKALDECASLLKRHGGHAMAAGFTVKNEQLPELKLRLGEIAFQQLSSLDLTPTLRYDLEVNFSDLLPEKNDKGAVLHPTVIEQLQLLEPCGMTNPEALFVGRNLTVRYPKAVGSDKKHLKFSVNDGRYTFDAIAFNKGYMLEDLPAQVDLLFAYEVNEFQGRQSLQLNVRDIKPANQQNGI